MAACLQAGLATAPAPDWQAYPFSEIDFHQLLAMCQHHEVTPLVYKTLKTLEIGEKVLEPFRLEVHAQTHWAFGLTQQLLAVLRSFQAAQVPVLPYKGVVLSQILFADIARRPTKDIDIVVPVGAYQQAKACLHALGYRGPSSDTGALLDEAWEAVYIQRLHHVKFFREDDAAAVELHWRLSPDFRGSHLDEEVWSSLNPYTFFGIHTVVPNMSLLFEILCEHGAAHHYFRLKWLFDIAVLIDQGNTARGFSVPHAPRLHNQLVATQQLCQHLFVLESVLDTRVTATQRWLVGRILEQFATFPITRITGANRYRFGLALLNTRDPHLIWPIFRHYLYENDSFRWHRTGWSSHLASVSRLFRYLVKR